MYKHKRFLLQYCVNETENLRNYLIRNLEKRNRKQNTNEKKEGRKK